MLERKNKPTVMHTLRDARRSRSLTAQQFATMAGGESATVVAVEDGEYAPSISLSLRLAWAIGYPAAVIVWTFAIRELVRNRRPVRYHESCYGDG